MRKTQPLDWVRAGKEKAKERYIETAGQLPRYSFKLNREKNVQNVSKLILKQPKVLSSSQRTLYLALRPSVTSRRCLHIGYVTYLVILIS